MKKSKLEFKILKITQKVSQRLSNGMNKSTLKKIFFGTLFILSFFALGNAKAFAASLQVIPATGSYHVGDTLKVSVTVSSSDQAINAVSGILSFSKDTLQFLSLSKNASILTIWAQEPSEYDTDISTGNISFEGVVPNPGFMGNQGKVVDVFFKVKSEGSATLPLSSASVLANDGMGTNILKSLFSGTFSFNPAPAAPSPMPPEENKKPAEAPQQTQEIKTPEKPGITDYTSRLNGDSFLVIKGNAEPEMNIGFSIQKIKENPVFLNLEPLVFDRNDFRKITYKTKSDIVGGFVFVSDQKLDDGVYEVKAKAIDAGGNESGFTEPIMITVGSGLMFELNQFLLTNPLWAIAIIILFFVSIILSWFGWRKFKITQRRLIRRAFRAVKGIDAKFELLNEDIQKEITVIEAKINAQEKINEEEKDFLIKTKKKLIETEDIIDKEMLDFIDEM